MSVQIIPVIYQGANYRVEKSFSMDSPGAMLPHKARFVTLKVLYGVSGNLSLVFIYLLLHFHGCGNGISCSSLEANYTQRYFKKYSRHKQMSTDRTEDGK